MTYGIQIAEKDDKYLALVEGGSATGEHLIAGTSILEFLPVLGRLPTWLPGASFLRTLERCREAVRQLRFVPWNDTKHGVLVSIIKRSLMQSPELKHDPVQEGVYDANNIAAEMREALSHLAHESAAEEEAVALDIAAAVYSGESIPTVI